MKTEIEVKFVDVDIEDIRARLEKAGAVLEQPMRLMRRALIETESMAKDDAFIRLRDEGDRVTLTYKKFESNSLSGAREQEVVVSDFASTMEILQAAELTFQTVQESRRETWRLNDVEVVIDEWPWINPYIEIEGPSEETVQKAARTLGFDWSKAVFGGADVIYHLEYPNMTVRGVIDIPFVCFDDPVPKEFLGK